MMTIEDVVVDVTNPCSLPLEKSRGFFWFFFFSRYTTTMNEIDIILSQIENPKERAALEDLRKTLHELLPGAVECISYGIPTLKVGGK